MSINYKKTKPKFVLHASTKSDFLSYVYTQNVKANHFLVVQ